MVTLDSYGNPISYNLDEYDDYSDFIRDETQESSEIIRNETIRSETKSSQTFDIQESLIRDETVRNETRLCWMNDGYRNTRVIVSRRNEYLSSGWFDGRLNNNKGDRTSRRYKMYVDLIKQGISSIDASQKLGISRSTFWRWSKKKIF